MVFSKAERAVVRKGRKTCEENQRQNLRCFFAFFAFFADKSLVVQFLKGLPVVMVCAMRAWVFSICASSMK
jgi:hypothetical protein